MHYTSYALPLLFAILIFFSLAIYARRFKDIPAAAPFSWGMSLCGVWALAYAVDILILNLPGKLITHKFRFAAATLTVPMWLIMAICHTGRSHRLSMPRIAVLFVIPVISAGLVFTNELHNLDTYNYRLVTSGPFPVL